ncbi:hypothetical protein [Glutamicibacter sp. TV12E]|uniref:hypothetical protein n=1 Tax=Glutamicibacter sp. TV12E TaxID=3446362 RepID=UPI004034853F
MTLIIEGQTDALALLAEMNRPSPRADAVRRSSAAAREFVPTPENPVHCAMCGAKLASYFDSSVSHSPMGWMAGQRMCTAMNLTRNHVKYAVVQITKALAGEQPGQCCWDKRGLHGKAIRKPNVVQLADHLRWQIDHSRTAWGVRAGLFDEWVGAYLLDHGVLKYSLDPDEYPWEFVDTI